MRSVNLAGTRIAVSRLGLGTASLHHVLTSSGRQRLLAHAHETGITYFDTAPLYGHGIAERELGRFLQGRRSGVTVATKFGLPAGPLMCRFPLLLYGRLAARHIARRAGLQRPATLAPVQDFSSAAATRSFDASLRRLRIDCVDVLYLHEPALAMIPDPVGLADALTRLRESGKVRHIGLSGSPRDCAWIHAAHPRLAEVLQIDAAAAGEVAAGLELSRRAPDVTFGHFRNQPAVTDAAPAGEMSWLDRTLTRVAQFNPSGVILFSSRYCTHIDEVSAALRRADARF